MYTTNPEKLQIVVHILKEKKADIDAFFHDYIFNTYRIDIENCLVNQNLDDAKRLLDFSFTTRQGGQSKSAIENYEREKDEIVQRLKSVMAALVYDEWEPRKRYEMALALINDIEDVGQKIASMFLKFIVYYSKNFAGKAELERELLIPFDSHVLKLLFTKFDGKKTERLDLYNESINQAALYYDVQTIRPVSLANTKLLKLQRNIRNDFDKLRINEPPIVLDYLWYVGTMYCSKSFGDIGCRICFLKDECKTGKTSKGQR